MSVVKELLREPVIRKLYTEYYYKLEAAYTSYDTYIREYEESHPASLHIEDEERIGVFNFDFVTSNDDLMSIKCDYAIFTSEPERLDANSPAVILKAFDENPQADIIYGDEDELNSNETVRLFPQFKPGWSPDTLKDYFYMGNAVAFRTSVIKSFVSAQLAKANDKACFNDIYDMTLKLTKDIKREKVLHIDRILFHGKYIKKLFPQGCTNYDLTDKKLQKELISIVIPSKDNPQILGNCLRSVINLTHTVRFEIIVIDNGSNEENRKKTEELIETLNQDLVACGYVENGVDTKVIRYEYRPQPFNFSRMCNQGAAMANGSFLLFLNDDIEVREGKWLLKMLKVASRKNAGAVGAKLYYPNSMMIQHAGITNLRLGPVHKLQFKDDNAHYYLDMNNGVRNCIAVTGACLLVAKSAFSEVGGFAEELEVAFNDVDLCFRLYENGYYNAVCNNTHLWHHESLSRGDDSSQEKLERLKGERELLYVRHPQMYGYDPYYSRFLSEDILDTNYSFINEYDYRNSTYEVQGAPFNRKIKDSWYNECLMVSLEYAGDFAAFEKPDSESTGEALVFGYGYVAGSDNALFERKLILMGKNNSFIYPLPEVYRPDLEINLDPEENALMCGFSVVIDLKKLPEDDYRIGIFAACRCSRLKLYRETNKYVRVTKE